MPQPLLHYSFGPGIEAFTTRRDSVLPYPVIQGHQIHGTEVAIRFKEAGFPMDAIWSFQGLGDGTPMSGGHHIDLWEANKWILLESGVKEENIWISGIDTFLAPDFFSARREGIECGRNINAIRII